MKYGTPWLGSASSPSCWRCSRSTSECFTRRDDEVSVKEALLWTGVWISLAMRCSTPGSTTRFGHERALEFLSGYVIKKALSVDNIFVFIVIFRHFAVPSKLQHRRAAVRDPERARAARAVHRGRSGAAHPVSSGWATSSVRSWCLRVLSCSCSVKARSTRARTRYSNCFGDWCRRSTISRGAFHDQQAGSVTPRHLLVLFADPDDRSGIRDGLIPAIFAVARDPFIVFTSNIFAILGPARPLLRACRHDGINFDYLKFGLSLVLLFVGAKMLLAGAYI